FESLGGFKPMKVFEDLDFSRRLGRRGKVVTLYPGVVSSARRFARRGPVRTTWSDVWQTCHYLAHSGEQERWSIPNADSFCRAGPKQMKARLIVFVRAPRVGQVKTRLAQAIGATAAFEAYTTLVQHLLNNLQCLSQVELRFTPDDAAAEIA